MISGRQRRTRRAAGPQLTRGRCAVGPQAHVSVRLRTRLGPEVCCIAPDPARMGARAQQTRDAQVCACP